MTNEQAIKVLKMIEAHGSLAIQAKEKAIQALESQRWISVSKKNPEIMGTYITTFRYGEIYGVGTRFYHGRMLGWEDSYVIAWCELPQPYKAESEDKE